MHGRPRLRETVCTGCPASSFEALAPVDGCLKEIFARRKSETVQLEKLTGKAAVYSLGVVGTPAGCNSGDMAAQSSRPAP